MKSEIEWISVKDRLPECSGKFMFVSGRIGETASIVLYHKDINIFETYVRNIFPDELRKDIEKYIKPIKIYEDSYWAYLPIPPQNLKSSKFNIGDKVQIKGSWDIGEVLEINNVIPGENKYLVKFGAAKRRLNEYELEKVISFQDYTSNFVKQHIEAFLVDLSELYKKENKEFKVGDRVIWKKKNIKGTFVRYVSSCSDAIILDTGPAIWIEVPGRECKKLRSVKKEWKSGDRLLYTHPSGHKSKAQFIQYSSRDGMINIGWDIFPSWSRVEEHRCKRLVKKKKS